MNMRTLLAGLTILATMAIAPRPGAAADKPKVYNEVTAVDVGSITLYRSPTKSEKFTVTSATKVIVDYRPAKFEDVKVGMRATVYHKPNSDEATSINARSMK